MIETTTNVKQTQQKKVLAMLRRGKVSSAEFYAAYIPRFPARIHELKKLGYDIRRESGRDHMFNYFLVEEKDSGDGF